MSPRSPKRWLRPGSRRWREFVDEDGEELASTEILKTTWGDNWQPPVWARLAHKHGWITIVALCRLPDEHWVATPGRQIRMSMYEDDAFMRMIKKDVSFAPA